MRLTLHSSHSHLYIISVNGLITAIFLTAECNGFAVVRKGLRVSDPKGSQRSTYYLQLPFRYAVPFSALSGVLHWLLSQTLHQFQVEAYDYTGHILPKGYWQSIISYGCSGLGLIFLVSLSGLMVLIVRYISFRRHNPKMPILSSCSLAISCWRDIQMRRRWSSQVCLCFNLQLDPGEVVNAFRQERSDEFGTSVEEARWLEVILEFID